MSASALPLKVPTSTPPDADADKTTTIPPAAGSATAEISSPHELTAFVETLLEQLDSKFDEMSSQILDRMEQMSTRVDALEGSIQDIINGDTIAIAPQSPDATSPGTFMRRSGSTLTLQ